MARSGAAGIIPARGLDVLDAALTAVRPERRKAGAFRLPVTTLPQPDETTCGPTCLHTVYRYWRDDESLDQIVARSHQAEHGGLLTVYLGCDALRKGYLATIYTYNISLFDPTWFNGQVDIAERLEQQRRVKSDDQLQRATEAYLEFLRLGGRLRFVDLTSALLHAILRRGLPIITGLSATYLYGSARERLDDSVLDDIAGSPAAHFVVLAGFNTKRNTLAVVDPYQPAPYGPSLAYWIAADRVLGAVLLGIITHDANLLVVHPGWVAAPDASIAPIHHFEPL